MPYSWADLPFFVALPVLLLGSSFFSGSETALFGLTRHERLQLSRSRGLAATAAQSLFRDERVLLVELMLGNMIVNVLFYVISTALLIKLDSAALHPLWILVAALVPLLAVVIFGEVLPKLIANTARIAWVKTFALPLLAGHRAFTPIAAVLSRFVVQPLGRLFAPPNAPARLDSDELASMLEMSQRRGVIGSDEQQLLKEVLDLSSLKVRDVMIPRVDIEAIDVNEPPQKLRDLIERSHRPRYVAIDGDVDHVLGIIYSRQFLLATRFHGTANLRKLVRGVMFVPEIQRVDQLLDAFRRSGTKFAVAVDEYGGTAGVITLKDVVERMVGDLDMANIPGEAFATSLTQIDAATWRVGGRLSVHEWAEAFGAENLPPRVSTVGGLVMSLLGHVPQTGEKVRLANLEIEVEQVTRGQLESAILRLVGPASTPAPAGGKEAGH
jgi:putative hemolysin